MTRTRNRHLPTSTKLNLVPMLDMFMFVLIFLIVSFAPQEAKYKSRSGIRLPEATSRIQKSSRLHLQLVGDQLVLNGKEIPGFDLGSATSEGWNKVVSAFRSTTPDQEAIVLSADRETAFGRIDRLVSSLSALGYGDIYFLGVKAKEVP